MKKLLVIAFALLIAVSAFAADGVPSPSTPAPLSDYLTISSTAQAAIATNTQLITATAKPQTIIITNEGGDILRIGTDTTVLTTGFGLASASTINLGLAAGVNLYVSATDTTNISYIKGE